jgi:hypothetical protein
MRLAGDQEILQAAGCEKKETDCWRLGAWVVGFVVFRATVT